MAVDHDDRRALVFEQADRRLVVTDDGCNGQSQRLDGVQQPNRHDIVESGVSQCFHQQCGLGGGRVIPRHSDDTQAVLARTRLRIHPQHLLGYLVCGTDGRYPLLGAQRRFLMVQDGAVGAVSFSKDPPEGGRRQ